HAAGPRGRRRGRARRPGRGHRRLRVEAAAPRPGQDAGGDEGGDGAPGTGRARRAAAYMSPAALEVEAMVEPRSFLFVTWEGGGNVPPVLGVARRLAAGGHDVTVLTEPCLQDAVEAIGARFVPFTRHFVRQDAAVPLLNDFEARDP